jgi:uncharacterized membrane protein YbhN (UPF0104 family)
MVLSSLAAHLLCIALFTLDLGARACRIRWYLRGLGHSLSLRQALECNAWGDAGAGLTPLRLGGEVSRVFGLLRAGTPATTVFMAIGIEVVVAYPVVILFGGLLFWRFAPDWWTHAAPQLGAALGRVRYWAAGVVAGVSAWRWRTIALREPARALHRVRQAWLAMPRWPIATGVPTSFINVACRSLMLPALALSLPGHPPFGVLMVGSFVLLYSQLVLPTPAGVGPVDLAFLSGAAGNLGPGDTGLLLAWRFYTVGAGALLGVVLALHVFGLRPLVAAVTGWRRGSRG